jgi:hypothetical protein
VARPEVTGRKIGDPNESRLHGEPKRKRRPPPKTPAAFTILEFCDAHRISRALYYELRKIGQAPDEARAGNRVIITLESAARWRRKREAAARKRAAIAREREAAASNGI